jgi:peptidase M1-like protein
MPVLRRQVRLPLLMIPVLAAPAAGQAAPPDRYETVFAALQAMVPRADRVATVRNATLQRDAIVLHLDEGQLVLTTAVAGRTIGAVFVGRGSVSFTPPLAVERAELKRVLDDSVIGAPITAAVLFFTDSTAAELDRLGSFQSGSVDRAAGDLLHDALDLLLDGDRRVVRQTSLMTGLMNGATDAFFYTQVKRARGRDLVFRVDPEAPEAISLLRAGGLNGPKIQVVSQFRPAERLDDSVPVANGALDPLRLESYRIDATIAKNLGFSATSTVRVTARQDAVRWAPFRLYSELRVDSVGDSAAADTFFRAKQSPELWVRFDPPIRAGESRALRVVYHGDLIGSGSLMDQFLPTGAIRFQLPPAMDRWLFVKSSESWFPRYGYDQAATVDLTFHAPKRYRLASIGRLADSRLDGDVSTTHWILDRPTDQICFNLGEFEETKITDPRIPPVTVQMNADAHRHLDQLFMGQANPQQDVAADVANSLAFFTRVYGPPLYSQYYATEVPFPYGQAFPGLMYLSVWTFETLNESGGEETFRSHEMAHQWWGIGVAPAGDRDVWLSEGFADFSGLWYTQIILRDNAKFFRELDARRRRIRSRGTNAPPIGIGWRVAQTDNPDDYSVVIYEKGAWVLQMLRNMMLNLRTMNEDAFTATMQDFYNQYRGRRASTADFQRVVERHTGLPMGWFFDEWVNGTAIPTYILSWNADPQPDGQALLHLRVRQEGTGPQFMMPVPLRIQFPDSGVAFVRVNVRGPVTEATLRVPGPPALLELNPFESVLAEVKTEPWH